MIVLVHLTDFKFTRLEPFGNLFKLISVHMPLEASESLLSAQVVGVATRLPKEPNSRLLSLSYNLSQMPRNAAKSIEQVSPLEVERSAPRCPATDGGGFYA